MIEASDAINTGVLALLQVDPKDGTIYHIQEGGNGMLSLVVEPHLQSTSASQRH